MWQVHELHMRMRFIMHLQIIVQMHSWYPTSLCINICNIVQDTIDFQFLAELHTSGDSGEFRIRSQAASQHYVSVLMRLHPLRWHHFYIAMATTSDLVIKKVAVKENNKFNTFFKLLAQGEESSKYW